MLGCGRCHDHKYDPFTQKEYYQLFAYFNNIAESGGVDRGGNAAPVLSLPTEEQTHRKAEVSHSIADYDKQLKKLDEKYPPTQEQSQRPAIAALFGAPATLGMVLALPDSFLISFSEREPILKKRGEARKALDEVNRSIVQTMVMEERQPQRDTFILIRGQYDKYGDKVSHDVPAMLSPLPKDVPANRLALAKWLVDPANPLTARVTVNRVWQHYFGSGLVKTTEDFGVQGEAPSHPELLDWLAVEFRESGWNVKALHKLIVSSATYRQASKMAPALRERDPENHLLARGPRHRLSSMVLRDQALSMSGLLVEKLGGPPVKPYQPPGIWEEMSFGKTKYVQDKGESLYRHSLYTFWRRAVPPTMMFDIASRQVCTVRSSRTNTPLHALTLLNDVTYVEASRVLAERLLTESSSDEERTSHLFRLATARKPSDAEKQVLARALERLRKQYGVDKDAALMLVSAGEKPRKADLDVVDHAAYTGLVSMVLNLDEVISKE